MMSPKKQGVSVSVVTLLTVISLCVLIFSGFANIKFYTEMAGNNVLNSFLYGGIGLIFEMTKIALFLLCVYFLSRGNVKGTITGLATGALYIVLGSISLIAGFGFGTSTIEQTMSDRNIASAAYQMNLTSLETANNQLSALAAYSNLNLTDLEQQAENELAKQVQNNNGVNAGTLSHRTSNCTNKSTYYYRYCDTYNALQADIAKAKEYQAALNAKQLAQSDMASMESGAGVNSSTLPAFEGLAALGILGNTPETAQYTFQLGSFAILELLGVFLPMLIMILSLNRTLTIDELEAQMWQIQQTQARFHEHAQTFATLPYSMPNITNHDATNNEADNPKV